MEIGLKNRTLNSILLAIYMQAVLFYYLFSFLRILIFPMLVCLSLGVLFIQIRKNIFRKNDLLLLFCYFSFALLVQIINVSISHFIIFLLIGPSFAYWVFRSSFNTFILRASYGIIICILLFLYLRHRTFIGVFADLSENYVSVLTICNVVLIASIELKQHEKVCIWPAFLGLFLSLLAYGRAGILCSLLLLLLFCYVRFQGLSKNKRIVAMVAFLLFLGVLTVSYYNTFLELLDGFELLNKFQERGLKSPSRGILIDEYLNHINVNTFFLGYQFDNNMWFLHYGLNPHNSYIRLHYEIGIVAIMLYVYVVVKVRKILKCNKVYSVMLIVLLLRAYTDVYLFFGFFDFLVFYILQSTCLNRINEKQLSC